MRAWSPPSTCTWVVIMMRRGSTAQMWRSWTFFTPGMDSMVAATRAGLTPGGWTPQDLKRFFKEWPGASDPLPGRRTGSRAGRASTNRSA